MPRIRVVAISLSCLLVLSPGAECSSRGASSRDNEMLEGVPVTGDCTTAPECAGVARAQEPSTTRQSGLYIQAKGGEPPLGMPVSFLQEMNLSQRAGRLSASPWIDPARDGGGTVVVHYQHRNAQIEGLASSSIGNSETRAPMPGKPLILDSRTTRLSLTTSGDWTFRLTRGTLSSLDQLVPNEQVRRTALSATYSVPLTDGGWETTLAWGRNSRKYRESTTGYLVESLLRFDMHHAVFGRLEQAGSDELQRENEAAQRQAFKLNRLTIGYFHETGAGGPFGFDIGAFASRYFVPATSAPAYGAEPTAYMMFIRLKFR